jgi:hypothetical protein
MADVDRYASDRLVAIDCDQALSVLRQAGIHVDDLSQPMDDLAAANGTTPRAVSEIVMSVARPVSDDNAEALPD